MKNFYKYPRAVKNLEKKAFISKLREIYVIFTILGAKIGEFFPWVKILVFQLYLH